MRSRVVGPGSERGITLVSVLVAVMLLSVGVVALSSSGVYVLAVKTESSSRTTALSIGVAHLEEVKTRDPATLESESPVRVDETGAENPSGRFVRSLEVSGDPDFEQARRVQVNVEYPAGRGRTGEVELVTIIYEGE